LPLADRRGPARTIDQGDRHAAGPRQLRGQLCLQGGMARLRLVTQLGRSDRSGLAREATACPAAGNKEGQLAPPLAGQIGELIAGGGGGGLLVCAGGVGSLQGDQIPAWASGQIAPLRGQFGKQAARHAGPGRNACPVVMRGMFPSHIQDFARKDLLGRVVSRIPVPGQDPPARGALGQCGPLQADHPIGNADLPAGMPAADQVGTQHRKEAVIQGGRAGDGNTGQGIGPDPRTGGNGGQAGRIRPALSVMGQGLPGVHDGLGVSPLPQLPAADQAAQDRDRHDRIARR